MRCDVSGHFRNGLSLIVSLVLVAAGVSIDPGARAETGSATYRLIGAGTASVTGVASSPVHELAIVGGGGTPVGISASTNVSVVAGGTSTQLPTDRMFRDGME